MRIGLYQFASGSRISDNMIHIRRAVKGAAAQSVRHFLRSVRFR